MKFEFISVPRIVFGIGQLERLRELAAPLGGRALVVHNGTDRGDILDRVRALCAGAIEIELFRQRGEPAVEDVDAACGQARAAGCDMVIGIGGGSALDSAKAVAGLLANGGAALDYMEVIGAGQRITKPCAPWIAIPTTAGTGAEVTRNAVIGSRQRHFKASIRSEMLLARIALVDAQLGIGAPPEVTAASGMDALCQLIESYTSTGATPVTDGLALQGITLAAGSIGRAFIDGSDLAARQDMALAALLSGITLTNAGLGAVHGFAAPMGANFAAPHGVICAALLPHVMRANIDAMRAQSAQPDSPISALNRYATIGRLLTSARGGDRADAGNVSDAADLSAAADAGVQFVIDLVDRLRIPRLFAFGVKPSDIPAMISLARKASSMRFNPIVLTDSDLAQVLASAL